MNAQRTGNSPAGISYEIYVSRNGAPGDELQDCLQAENHGRGDFLRIPRIAWGVGMSDKTIRTGLCPDGRERMQRLLRLLETGRVDPTPLTTHQFEFSDLGKAFHMMETKEDGMIKPLILF